MVLFALDPGAGFSDSRGILVAGFCLWLGLQRQIGPGLGARLKDIEMISVRDKNISIHIY